MSQSRSERRLAENEAVFREANEGLQKGIEETNRLAKEDGQPEFKIEVGPDELELNFYCECSDENCKKRIKATMHDYIEIHKNRSRFIVLPGHERESIEKVVSRHGKKYLVVEKKVTPPEDPGKLHPTSTEND